MTIDCPRFQKNAFCSHLSRSISSRRQSGQTPKLIPSVRGIVLEIRPAASDRLGKARRIGIASGAAYDLSLGVDQLQEVSYLLPVVVEWSRTR